MFVTVLIPTANRPDALRRCVESVLKNRHDSFEVIVLDQSDSPEPLGTSEFDGRINHLRMASRGKASALNAGLRLAKGDILALVDDDVEVVEDWLTLGVAALTRETRSALVFGTLLPCPFDFKTEFVPSFTPDRPARYTKPSEIEVPGIGMGGNMFARTSVVASIGGWDPCLGPGSRLRSGDDWDLAYRITAAGYVVLVAPDVTGTHWGVRHFGDGSVSRLINNNYFGIGGGLAKHLRCRGIRASFSIVRTLARCVASVLGLSLRAKRPRGGGRCLALAAGFRAGMSLVIDRKSGTFVTAASAAGKPPVAPSANEPTRP